MNIKYTNNENTEVIAETYQCEYPSIVYFEDVSNECVYITEKDVVNRTSRTFTMNETGFTFLSGYKYFIRITDLNGVELVELTRIYQTGFEPGTRSYGVCEASKCKVIIKMPIPNLNDLITVIGNDNTTTWIEGSYTATKDCYAMIQYKGGEITIDGVSLITGVFSQVAQYGILYWYPLKEGQTIWCRGSVNAAANARIYGLL